MYMAEYIIDFKEYLNKYTLTIIYYNDKLEEYSTNTLYFNSLKNLRLTLAVLLKDDKEYGDYIFLQKDFDKFLSETED